MMCQIKTVKSGSSGFLHEVRERCSSLGILLVLLLTASGQSMATSTSSSYTRETFLPYLSSAFYAAITGTSMYFGTNFINPNAVVMSGISMPPELLQDMANGEVVRVKVLIPPGAEYANFTVDTGQAGGVKWGVYSQDLSFCASQPSNGLQTCISAQDLRTDSLITGTLANYQGSAGGTNPTARYAYIVLQAGSAGFRWANITINMNINNPALYTPWRNTRSWAGGSGDCDGLGTTNCTASTTPTTPPPATFTIAASSQQVTAGGSFTLTASNGAISACTSDNPAVIAHPTVAAGGATASGVVASTATANSQVIISCTSTASTTASTTLTVTVPTFAISPGTQQVAAGATYTLTAQNGTLEFCNSSNTSVAPKPTVNTGGATATGTIVAGAAAGSQATITCASSAATSAAASVTVSSPVTAASFALTAMGISKLASTSAAITATANAAATGYWVAIPYSATSPAQPSTTQIEGGLDASNAPVTLKGSASMAANTATEFALTSLTANTSYQVFFYAKETANALSKTAIMPVALVTNSASSTAPAAITYASGGTSNANLTLSATVTPASNHTGTGNYYVAALVPKSFAPPYGLIAFLTAAQGATGQTVTEWKVWTGGALLPYSQETLQTKTISILDGKLDASSLTGTVVYAGYGVGGDATTGLGEVLVVEKIHAIK